MTINLMTCISVEQGAGKQSSQSYHQQFLSTMFNNIQSFEAYPIPLDRGLNWAEMQLLPLCEASCRWSLRSGDSDWNQKECPVFGCGDVLVAEWSDLRS